MNNKKNLIEELINESSMLNPNQIQEWLFKHEEAYKQAINLSSCRKWTKSINHNEIPYPCACPRREKACVFIELYYELNKITKQDFGSSVELITSDLLELVLVTQNKPYKKINLLIQTK